MNGRRRAQLKRWVWPCLVASAAVLFAWLIWRPNPGAPALTRPPARAPTQQQPLESARPTLDPELVG